MEGFKTLKDIEYPAIGDGEVRKFAPTDLLRQAAVLHIKSKEKDIKKRKGISR